jgi:hypothetical protein
MERWLTHAALRTRVQKVRASARDRDRERFRSELDKLAGALSEHLAVEASIIATLSGTTAAELRDGQRRVRASLDALVADLDVDQSIERCESAVAQFDVLLERQGDVERRAFRGADRERATA